MRNKVPSPLNSALFFSRINLNFDAVGVSKDAKRNEKFVWLFCCYSTRFEQSWKNCKNQYLCCRIFIWITPIIPIQISCALFCFDTLATHWLGLPVYWRSNSVSLSKVLLFYMFYKSFGEIRNNNMVMAVMTPPDWLKWPESP